MTYDSTSVIKKLILLFLVFAGLYFAKEFLIPFSIGTLLATLFLPFCKWMEGKKIHRGGAAFICLIVLLFIIAGITSLIGWQVSEITNDFDIIKQKSIETATRIQQYIYNHVGISLKKQGELLSKEQSFLPLILQGVAAPLPSIFTDFVLILIYILFLLYYRGHIKQFLLKLSSNEQENDMEKMIYNVADVSQQYLLGLSKMIVCLWIMYGIGFSIVGVKNALFFAFLCGLLEIVPFIGNITGTTITILVALVQGASLQMLIGIAGTYGAIQFIQGWVLEPLIVGSQVKINSLFTIIALVIGGIVWGLSGVFLAIPLMAMFKIVCDHIEPLKSYGFLIGEVQKKKEDSDFIKKLSGWYKQHK